MLRDDQEMKDKPRVGGEMRNGAGISAHIEGYHVTHLNCLLLQKSSVSGGTGEEIMTTTQADLGKGYRNGHFSCPLDK